MTGGFSGDLSDFSCVATTCVAGAESAACAFAGRAPRRRDGIALTGFAEAGNGGAHQPVEQACVAAGSGYRE